MMKKKLLLISLLLIIIFSLFLTTDYLFLAKTTNYEIVNNKKEKINLDSSLFTQKDNESLINQEAIDFEADGFIKDLENDQVILYTNLSTGAIRIYVKETNYTWCSDVINIDKYDLNNAGIRQVQSSFNLVYRDEKDNVKQVRTKESRIKLNKEINGNEILFKVEDTDSGIKFNYSLILNGNKLKFVFDHTSIVEDKCRITSLTFFPYLGSAYLNEVPGYAFMPSGSGALIRFDQESTISSIYTSAFYGEDANLTINNEGDLLNLPIYGFVHGINQNALMVNIKDGVSFAKINYSPASIDKNFHMVYPTFNLRETYQLTFSTNKILIIPQEYYHNNIEMEYTILTNDNANYSGMAKSYQKDLIDEGTLIKNNDVKENISLDIEAFGRDYESGLILKKYYNMTTTNDIIDFHHFLTTNGVNNIFYSLRAFNKNGYSNQSVSNYKFDHKLGSMKDLNDLEAYFYYNPIESYNSSRKYPSKVLVNLFNEKNYIKVGVDKYKFYANMKDVLNYTPKAISHNERIALDGLGYRLYGDNNNKLNKTDSLKKISELLGNNKYPMYSPNYYMLKNTLKYLNMPLYSERLRFYTDSVPFLQILLKGYIDYYSSYLNFSSNTKMDILKCIEYGIYPAYLVTKEESYLLADTLSSNYYATTFDKCKDEIVETYNYINNALKEVIGAEIMGRTTLESGIYLVEYSNGKKIIVNYSDIDYNYSGHTITSLGYEVI